MPSRPVFFQTCPATDCQGLRHHRSPGEMPHPSRSCRHLGSLTVPRSPPAVPVFDVTSDHPLVSSRFYILSLYASVLPLLPSCFHCFGVLPCHSFSSLCRNSCRIDGTGDGNSSYSTFAIKYYNATALASVIIAKTFFIAGSYTQEAIRNHRKGFYAL